MSRFFLSLASLLLLSAPTLGQQLVGVTTYNIAELQSSVAAASLPAAWKQGLLATLQTAQQTYAQGDVNAVVDMLEAFADEIEAQTPTFVSSELAAPWLVTVDGLVAALDAGFPLGGVQVGRPGAFLRVTDPGSPAFGTELNIPPNALSETTFVSIVVPMAGPTNRVLSQVGPGVVLGPEGLELNAPATLILPYPDEDGDGIVDGTDFSSEWLKVGALGRGDRIAFPRRELDAENHTQAIPITRFERYWNVAWRWNAADVLTYRFSWPTSGVSIAPGDNLDTLRGAVREAINVWSPALDEVGLRFEEVPANQPATFRFAFFARRAPVTTAGDGALELFANEDPAVAGTFFDVLFNSDFGSDSRLVWTTDNGGNPAAVSIEAVALHGIGHLLGLSDQPGDGGSDIPVMSADSDLLNPEICLHPPDVSDLRRLYGVAPAATFSSCPHAEIAVTPADFDFGRIEVGSSAETTFAIENNGSGTLFISEILSDGEFEVDLSGTDLTLRPGQSSSFNVVFRPSEGMGQHQNVIQIGSNTADSPILVNIRGTTPVVAPACTLVADPTEITSGESAVLSWTTRNFVADAEFDGGVGPIDLTDGGISVSPAESTSYTLSVSNAAGTGSCAVEVVVVSLPSSEVIWTQQFGAEGDDTIQAVAAGEDGVFVAGENGGTVGGFGQAFLGRYDRDGNEIWTVQIPTARASGIGVDPSAVFIVGETEGTLAGSPTSFGSWDGFLRKYDLDGTELWTRQFGSASRDRGMGIAVDPAGSVYVVGVTEGALQNQVSFGSWDAFIRKYDFDGNELWTRQFGTVGDDFARDVGFDPSGILVAGDVGGGLPGQTGAGGSDVFVRKYDPAGTEVWTDQFGTTGSEFVEGLAIWDAGVFLVGEMEDVFTAASYDAFVRKYDLDGEALWTRPFGASGASDFAAGVAVDATGVYIGGETEGEFPGQSSLGSVDAFVRKYDANGNEIWTRQYGSEDPEDSFAVTVDASGLYLAGTRLTNGGSVDAFVLKISK